LLAGDDVGIGDVDLEDELAGDGVVGRSAAIDQAAQRRRGAQRLRGEGADGIGIARADAGRDGVPLCLV